MKKWTTIKTCRVQECHREIHERKEFCMEHWTLVPWDLKEWLIRTIYVTPDYAGIHKGHEYEKAVEQCAKWVYDFIIWSRPKLNE